MTSPGRASSSPPCPGFLLLARCGEEAVVADVKALIKKQREELATPIRGELEARLGGEEIKLEFDKVAPSVWDELVSRNPPRPGVKGDGNVGYYQAGVSRSYPGVILDGEVLDAETWAEVFDVLDAVHRNAIGTSLWGLNILTTLEQLTTLGKGSPGGK